MSARIIPFCRARLTDEQHERAFRLSPIMEALAAEDAPTRRIAERFAPKRREVRK